jgi:hypothetical protein
VSANLLTPLVATALMGLSGWSLLETHSHGVVLQSLTDKAEALKGTTDELKTATTTLSNQYTDPDHGVASKLTFLHNGYTTLNNGFNVLNEHLSGIEKKRDVEDDKTGKTLQLVIQRLDKLDGKPASAVP